MDWIKVFAPATIGNIGPGFDVLGLAVSGWGDVIEARKIDSGVLISEIESEHDLPADPDKNTAGIAAREVTARRPGICHKQRIANERGIANHIANAIVGMARRVDYASAKLANRKLFAVDEQVIKLMAVCNEWCRKIKNRAKVRLHSANTFADCDTPTDLGL